MQNSVVNLTRLDLGCNRLRKFISKKSIHILDSCKNDTLKFFIIIIWIFTKFKNSQNYKKINVIIIIK